MALATGTSGSFFLAPPRAARSQLSLRWTPSPSAGCRLRCRKKSLPSRIMAASVAPASGSMAPAISLTEKALSHLSKMRAERDDDLCLRIGVKQGGCSGMSYTMELESRASASPGDSVVEYDGFAIVCDPMSLLYVYGMQLDYSDALIGGGFAFRNPNATKTCGCGKSFATGANSAGGEATAATTTCNN